MLIPPVDTHNAPGGGAELGEAGGGDRERVPGDSSGRGDEEARFCEKEDLKDNLGSGTGTGLDKRRERETGYS